MYCVMETTWGCGEPSLEREGVHAWVHICLVHPRSDSPLPRVCTGGRCGRPWRLCVFQVAQTCKGGGHGGRIGVCACAGPFNVASLRNVGLLGSRSGLGSTGGVCREGLRRDVLERERQEGKRGGSPAWGFQEGKPDIGTCQRCYLPPSPTSLLLPPLLAPEGCWQTDRQTDSAHIDWLHGTEPKAEPLNTQAWIRRSRESRGSG